jgi:LacI family transcriptional regulator
LLTIPYPRYFCCTGDDDDLEQEDFIKILTQRRVDGIIIGSIRRHDENLLDSLQEQVPCVLYHKRLDTNKMDYVVLDNKSGAFQAVQHLIELGHTRIGFLHG